MTVLLAGISAPAWMDRAACDGADLELFYPNTASEESPKAVAICRGCDARPDCLQYALDRGEPFGIWGGLTTPERRELRASSCDTPTTQEEEPVMAEDLHGEAIGDERVTYGNPPVLAPAPAGAPLPPEIAAAARLLVRTEGHPDRKIRSARRIVAQALLHLDELVREHEALDRTVDRSLALVQNAQPAERVTAPTPATPAATGTTATGQPRKRAKSPAQQLIDQHQLDPADIRRYGLEHQLCGERGGLSLQVVEKYLAHRGTA